MNSWSNFSLMSGMIGGKRVCYVGTSSRPIPPYREHKSLGCILPTRLLFQRAWIGPLNLELCAFLFQFLWIKVSVPRIQVFIGLSLLENEIHNQAVHVVYIVALWVVSTQEESS